MTDCSDLMQNPFYTHPCSEVTEDHARHMILHQYTTCLKVVNVWAVPNNDVAVWLTVPAIVDFLVGSCLWNPEYGYFRVTAFDKQAQKVQVQRVDIVATAAPGTQVPACTKFIVTVDV